MATKSVNEKAEKHKVKYASVSSKRQITIPKEFYDALGIEAEVTLELMNNKIVIKPVKENTDDFSEEILSDLISEGYEGNELMEEFKNRKKMIKPAINRIVEETLKQKSYQSLDEMLDDEEDC